MNYKKPNQKQIRKLPIKKAALYKKEKHFPEGSMGPKIEAAIEFIKKGGKTVIITSASNLQKALKGQAGTIITR